MEFRKRRRITTEVGISWIVVTIFIITTLFLFGQSLVGTLAVVFLGPMFLLVYAPMNKIRADETSVTEKTAFGSKTLPWKEVQQVGLVFRAYKKRLLIKESVAPLDPNHTEIYILNYRTSDAPGFMDSGKKIILDYNSAMWQCLKNNPQLHHALKQGELAASKTKLSLF